MKTSVYIVLLVIGLSLAVEIPTEEGVLILGEDNFDYVIKNNEFVLVEFYAPWCGHCKKLAPEYAKAANTLAKENPLHKLGKVDATINKNLGSKYKIDGYPTIKLFVNGEPQEYKGGRNEIDFLTYMRKKTGPPSKELRNVEDVTNLNNSADIAFVLFGNMNDVYKKIARKYEDMAFGHCNTKECLESYKVSEGTIVLFKKFDEERNDYSGENSESAISSFIDLYSKPLVMKFDDRSAQIIFGNQTPGLFLFMNNNADNTAELENILKSVASKIRGKLQVITADFKDSLEIRLADYVGVKVSDFPTIRIIDIRGDLKKYILQGDITEANIMRFVEDWENMRLKLHLRSEDIPTTQNEPVYKIVGKTFDDVVLDPTKDVLVEFYAPWCQHCKKLTPIYEELANNLQHNPNLIIAKIDATANDIESVSIATFPTIKFWPANNKINPIDYNEDRTIESFTKFLTVHGATSIKTKQEL